MIKIPPHLPPKTCDIKAHRTFKSIWGLLFLLAFAGLVSLTMTLSTLVWFVPSFIPDQSVLSTQKDLGDRFADIDLSVMNNTKKKLWYVYDRRQKVDGQFYPDNAKALPAIMFSSDGWAVLYDAGYFLGLERYWEGLDYQGTIYKVEKVFVDNIGGFIYVKFDGGGFPFVTFADWNKLDENSPVWEISRDSYKKHTLKNDSDNVNKRDYKIWQPQLLFKVSEFLASGDILINENGELSGIVNDDGRLLYSWMIEGQLASVLQNSAVDYRAVSWTGYMAHGFVKVNDYTKRVNGFYVKNSPTKISSSTVGVGDLVIKVQGAPVSLANLSRKILFAPEEFAVTVLRGGQEYEIMVKKVGVQ